MIANTKHELILLAFFTFFGIKKPKAPMCWNAPISIVFGVAMFTTAWYLRYIGYTCWRRSALALGLYGAMQLTQALNWLTVLPLADYGQCTAANRAATYLAYLIILLQFVVNVLALEVDEPAARRQLFTLPLRGALVVLAVGLAQLVAGDVLGWQGPTLRVTPRDFSTTLDPLVTCTYVGPNRYLLWRFRLYLSPLLPTFFVYQLFGLVVLAAAKLRHRLLFLVGFHGLALFSFLHFRGSAEDAAFWCHSTILLPLLFLADAYYEKGSPMAKWPSPFEPLAKRT